MMHADVKEELTAGTTMESDADENLHIVWLVFRIEGAQILIKVAPLEGPDRGYAFEMFGAA